MLYVADFETTTDPNDCRVWAWSLCEIGNGFSVKYDNNIETLMDFMKKSNNSTFYFHNLKFDSDSLFVWLFSNGYKHTIEKKDKATKTFNTLISDKGQFYSIEIIFEKKGNKTKKVTIYDSYKILPFKVEVIADAFGLPENKLEIDYDEYREPGHTLTDHEIAYIKNDVIIVAKALKELFDEGLPKMTQGSNALHDFKQITGKKTFERFFPTPDYDHDVRQSYKGGFTYLNEPFKEKDVLTGLVLDVNSLYPWVMYECPLPYGDPIFFKGKYEHDDLYPLYTQMITCQFDLKPNHIPTIQIKQGGYSFKPTEYLTTSGDEEVTMCMTSVDLELFFEHYNVYNPTYHSGWKFRSRTDMFRPYIDKWMERKIQATREKNKGKRTIAKLMLNALYGKFALNPHVRSKYPIYKEGAIGFEFGEWGERKPLYIPVGTFITAYARHKTITSAQKVYDLFAYADTDSLHLVLPLPNDMFELPEKELENLTTADLQKLGVPLPDDFEVDPVALGAWKVESIFTRARFLRQKSYIEDRNKPATWKQPRFNSKNLKKECEKNNLDYDVEIKKYEGWYDDNLLNITCAGMPSSCYEHVTWDNFHIHESFEGKLTPKHVKGGTVLIPTLFTIKAT